jgi:autophagy-related protein 9
MRQAARRFVRALVSARLLCIVISPFVSLYLFVHTMVKYVAALSTQPAVVAARQWTPLARWRYREFNELPHEFRKRLNRAYEPAQRYCESFPVIWLAVPASFLSFVVSGFIFALVALSLIDDNVMINADVALGRSGVWWLTVLGSVLALLRSIAPDPNAVYSPDEHLAAVCKVTHYMPQRWRGRAGDPAVRREFARDYDYRLAVLVRELISIAVAPLLLAWYVPRIAEPLVHFVDVSTVNVPGVGSVCQLALFRLNAGGGDPLYGSPVSGVAPEGGLRAQDGKLEKSLLLFRANHPQWRAPAESRGLVDNLRQFAERRLGTAPSARAVEGGDDFDQLMEASVGLQRRAVPAGGAAAPPPVAAYVPHQLGTRRRGAAALRVTGEFDENIDPMEALTEVIEQYHAEREAAGDASAGHRSDIDDSADFDAGPVRPLDWNARQPAPV